MPKKIARCLALLLALLLTAFLYSNTILKVEDFRFSSAALPKSFDGFRIVQLSDLHGRHFGKNHEKLIAAVESAKPDLIALTGDFVDKDCTSAELEALMRGLTSIAPTYYVTGNHEWGAGKARETVSAFSSWGVICLQNEYVPLERNGERILLAGIHDPNGYADQKSPEALAQELYNAEKDPFWLLLAHRNNLFNGNYCRLGADLTLCGHAHGGIWRLPFTDGLLGTDMKFFPDYTSGFYLCSDAHEERTAVFVSRGLGNSPHYLPRLFNRPQVAVITLKSEAAT